MLDGQLCYTVDISSVLPDITTLDGKVGELLLFLDYNKERSIEPENKLKAKSVSQKRFITMEETLAENDKEARIFIHTLKSHTGFGAGSYIMSSLKRMSPTEDFRKLSPTTRGCANEDQQHCLRKKYLDQKIKECVCAPWEFPKEPNTMQVREAIVYQ